MRPGYQDVGKLSIQNPLERLKYADSTMAINILLFYSQNYRRMYTDFGDWQKLLCDLRQFN